MVERRLLSYGIPREKLVRIPIGVDTATFTPPTEDIRQRARARLGIPEDRYCIGSFQKDGVGWGEGSEPKYIKGPDVFVESIARLAKEVPVFVLLTGPARGYVRAGLERVGVPYRHVYASEYRDLVECFHALDLYLVTSREEGGPMALMESMATGVPVVSTRVGMAEDLLIDGETGGLVGVGEVDAMCDKAISFLANPDLAARICTKARERVLSCDWREVADQHHRLVYCPLL
jgi:glycosyltransferase involved in cell wall biosynthesis